MDSAGASHEVLGPAHERFSDGSSVLELHMPKPHIVVVRGSGHASVDHAKLVIEWRQRALKQALPIVLFDDLAQMTTYEGGVRIMLTQWVARHRARIQALHILPHGKLARMGVSVANLALGGFITAHSARHTFEEALRRALG
jgi:hypothetical protein